MYTQAQYYIIKPSTCDPWKNVINIIICMTLTTVTMVTQDARWHLWTGYNSSDSRPKVGGEGEGVFQVVKIHDKMASFLCKMLL